MNVQDPISKKQPNRTLKRSNCVVLEDQNNRSFSEFEESEAHCSIDSRSQDLTVKSNFRNTGQLSDDSLCLDSDFDFKVLRNSFEDREEGDEPDQRCSECRELKSSKKLESSTYMSELKDNIASLKGWKDCPPEFDVTFSIPGKLSKTLPSNKNTTFLAGDGPFAVPISRSAQEVGRNEREIFLKRLRSEESQTRRPAFDFSVETPCFYQQQMGKVTELSNGLNFFMKDKDSNDVRFEDSNFDFPCQEGGLDSRPYTIPKEFLAADKLPNCPDSTLMNERILNSGKGSAYNL